MVAPVSLWWLVAAPCPFAWSAGTWGLSHAMQNRRAAVVLVNCAARSGSAFFRAAVSRRVEFTAL